MFLAAGPVLVLVPYGITGWQVQAPFWGWAGARWVGAALILLGGLALLDPVVRFVLQGRGTPAPFAPPRRLVVTGLYRHVRNRMYLAVLVVLLGQTLLFGHIGVLIYAIFVALYAHAFVVLYEEPTLLDTFGPE